MCGTAEPQDNGEVRNFRYKLSPKQRVNGFEPKKLTDFNNIRATQLGQVFFDEFNTLPDSPAAGVVWDAGA